MATPLRTDTGQTPQPVPPPTPDELAREYVSGGRTAWGQRQAQALPWTLDDQVARDFGDDIWDRMMVDSQVTACVTILKAAILEDGVQLAPALDDENEPEYARAREIADEASAMLEDLDIALTDSLWDMLSAMGYGHSIAEEVYELRPGLNGRELLQLKTVKPKPRRTTAFVVDAFLNVLGIMAARPGASSVNVSAGTIISDDQRQNILPREKFAVITWRPREADPRGTSLLRPAFDPWWRKRQVQIEFLKFLTQFASPSMWATTPEKSPAMLRPVYAADGTTITTPAQTPEQALATAMQGLRNGTFAAFAYGTQLNLIQSTGEGRAFLAANAQANAEITKAILTQSLATEEGDHQARAAAEVHENVLDTLVKQGKQTVVRMIRRDILAPWVVYNYGPQAERLVPKPTLGTTEQQDRTKMWNAAGAVYKSGLIADDQLHAVDEVLGLPARDMEAWTADKNAEQERKLAAAAAIRGQRDPAAQGDGTTEDQPPADDQPEAQ